MLRANQKELYAATCMVLSDWPKEKVDAIFFYSRGGDDFDGLFELASMFLARDQAYYVAICTKKEGIHDQGYFSPERKYYFDNFLKHGVDVSRVVSIEVDQSFYNTKQESNSFLDLAQKRGWKSAAILAQPHQILREFLGVVASMRIFCRLRLYALFPQSVSWEKMVFGSCSIHERKERFDHIFEELERISRYQEKGDLCTFSEFFEYMRNRDKIP